VAIPCAGVRLWICSRVVMSPRPGEIQQERGDCPVIVLDGSESSDGRALLTISALYWCAEWLPDVEVRFSDVSNEDVALAAQALRWDIGVSVSLMRPSMIRSPLLGVDLYRGDARTAGRVGEGRRRFGSAETRNTSGSAAAGRRRFRDLRKPPGGCARLG
jgi:hypothetical protein